MRRRRRRRSLRWRLHFTNAILRRCAAREQRIYSLQEVAAVLGLRPWQVRDVERRALHKLRDVCELNAVEAPDVPAERGCSSAGWAV